MMGIFTVYGWGITDMGIGAGTAMAVASVVATVASTAMSVMSAQQSAAAQNKAANYQAQVAANNQKVADQNATYARQVGAVQEQAQRMKAGEFLASQRAAGASNGFDVNAGSNLDLQSRTASLGEMDALTIRANADRQAYGYQTQATSFGAESQLDTMKASDATAAGNMAVAGSIVGGASALAKSGMQFQQAGVFS
jgi:hypothetical protein